MSPYPNCVHQADLLVAFIKKGPFLFFCFQKKSFRRERQGERERERDKEKKQTKKANQSKDGAFVA